jgi:carbamate kinase
MRVVAALGGNALSPPGDDGSVAALRRALATTAPVLADLVAEGVELVVTHGNGPQVGRILLQQEYAAERVPPMPLDVCGAQSQGQLGYLLAQAIDSALRRRDLPQRALCLLTQVLVDARDPAFERPTKPVGPSYDSPAEGLAEQPDGRWRRVVPSPAPRGIVEAGAIRSLVTAGQVVVAGGGGGVPVVATSRGLRGVDAVVDKDRTAALLGADVDADLLLILTNVDAVALRFGTPEARPVRRLRAADARGLLRAGEFPAGSMGPKIEACCQFAESTGRPAVIAGLRHAAAALHGHAGTTIES